MKPSVREAIDARLSGVRMSREDRARVLERARKEEERMRKKISTGLMVALALTALLAGTALAAAGGIFEFFAGRDAGIGLEPLEQNLAGAAVATGQTLLQDEVELTVEESYYDGETLYLSWSIGGQTRTEEPWTPDASQLEAMEATQAEYLDVELSPGTGVLVTTVSEGDGLDLADGTYINPSMGDSSVLEDGTRVNWMRYETPLPETARQQQSLDLVMTLYRTQTAYYMDADGAAYITSLSHEREELPFRIECTDATAQATASASFENYTAECTITAGILNNVAVHANVVLTGMPAEWYDAVVSMEDAADAVYSYRLYIDGEMCQKFDAWLDGDATRLELWFGFIQPPLPETDENTFTLVPVYTQSGEHPDEALQGVIRYPTAVNL